jgi:hypothetical protein
MAELGLARADLRQDRIGMKYWNAKLAANSTPNKTAMMTVPHTSAVPQLIITSPVPVQ